MAAFAVAQMNAVARVSVSASTMRAQAAPVRLAALNRSTTLAGLVNKSRHNLVARTARLTVRAADTDTEVVETAATDAAPAPAKRERGERGAVGPPRARGGGRPKREITVNFDDIAVGNIYKGTVASVQAYGAFINFGAKSDGLVHISELTDGFVADVGEVLTQGQAVDVRIISVDAAAGRVSLSMRTEEAEVVTTGPAATGEVELDDSGKPIRQGKVATRAKKAGGGRDRKASPPVKKGEKYQAIVKTITGFGAFVELVIEGVEGVEGLVHISQLSEGIVSTVESVVSVGQEVSVRVQSVDGSKLSLTMKEEFDIAALNAAAGAATGPSFSVLELALKNAGISREMFAEQPNAPKKAAPAPAAEAAPAPVAEAVAAPVEEAPAHVEEAPAHVEEAPAPVVAAAEAAPAPAADAAPPAST